MNRSFLYLRVGTKVTGYVNMQLTIVDDNLVNVREVLADIHLVHRLTITKEDFEKYTTIARFCGVKIGLGHYIRANQNKINEVYKPNTTVIIDECSTTNDHADALAYAMARLKLSK